MSAVHTPTVAVAPKTAAEAFRADVLAGFLVFLIALPLSLGISMASGCPPIAGVLTAMVGGMVCSFLGSAKLTIKGPAAGLIVIVLGAVTELGAGDPTLGYKRMLAVGVVAGVLQIVLSVMRAGTLGTLMPPMVVHGMLAAIGVIIISKQAHVLVGVRPTVKEPLELLAAIPHSIATANWTISAIGLLALGIMVIFPRLPFAWIKKVPAQLVVLLVTIPLGLALQIEREHVIHIASHADTIGPSFLVQLPSHLVGALTLPDFSVITSATSIKYIVMFTLVGSIEALLTVAAIDSLDPAKQASDLNKDLRALGIGNVVSAMIGGLPMISEVVRSKANLDAGATSPRANFFHGFFLLAFVALLPMVLREIPLTALAAMLIFVGYRLASPSEFGHAFAVGKEQLAYFVVTMVVTLATDLLIGVATGLVLKMAVQVIRGVKLHALFKVHVHSETVGQDYIVHVEDAAIFTNFLSLRNQITHPPAGVKRVVVDFSRARVVDHTTQVRLRQVADEWHEAELVIRGLDDHTPVSGHEHAARVSTRPRPA